MLRKSGLGSPEICLSVWARSIFHVIGVKIVRDPGDELVLEAVVNGHADAILTFNQKDFGDIPVQFGVEVLFPVDALRRIKS